MVEYRELLQWSDEHRELLCWSDQHRELMWWSDQHRELMWWSDQHKDHLWLFELTISYKSLVLDARERKRAKYQDMVETDRAAGYKTELITVEVGSRRMLGDSHFDNLRAASRKEMGDLCLQVIRTTVLVSFRVWGSRILRSQ